MPHHSIPFHQILVVAGLCACAAQPGDAPDAQPGPCSTEGRLLPLEPGRSWTYRVEDLTTGETATKMQTVGALEELTGAKAGISAFRVTTTKATGMVVSWQEDTGDEIRRHLETDLAGSSQSEERYEPYRVRVSEAASRLVVGTAWTDEYSEVVTDLATRETTTIAKTETWTVESLDDQVTVPAGTFCANRFRRVSSAATGGSDKTYWFVRGVGKVKEVGSSRVEELTAY